MAGALGYHRPLMSSRREEPKTLGRYRVERRLAQGGMGVVYLGRDPRLDRPVALKTLQVSELVDPERAEGLKERFLAEPRITARLRHANVVPVYDAGVDPVTGLAWLALEYVEGGNLADLIEAGIKIKDSMKVLDDVASALDHAHEAGIVHRDVKPHNILIDVDGRARLTDFGIAHEADAGRTKPGEMIGAPAYMAPEQVGGGEVTAATDVHALAVVLYEMLTGHRPFEGTKVVTTAQAVLTLQPPPPSRYNHRLPRSLDAVFKKALSKIPAKRHQTASAFAADVRKALEELGSAIDEDATTVIKQPGGAPVSLSLVMRGFEWARSHGAAGLEGLRTRFGDRNLKIAGSAAGLLALILVVTLAVAGGGNEPTPPVSEERAELREANLDPGPVHDEAQRDAPGLDEEESGESPDPQHDGSAAESRPADAKEGAVASGQGLSLEAAEADPTPAQPPARDPASSAPAPSPPKPAPTPSPSVAQPREPVEAAPSRQTARRAAAPKTRIGLEVHWAKTGVLRVESDGRKVFEARVEQMQKSPQSFRGLLKETGVAEFEVPSDGRLTFRFTADKKDKRLEAQPDFPLPQGGSARISVDIGRWLNDLDLKLVDSSPAGD